MDDTITQIYFDIIDVEHPGLAKLIRSMMDHGQTLEECLELTQFHMNYDTLYSEIAKCPETQDFTLWLLPKVSSGAVIRDFRERGYDQVDIWRPILTPNADGFKDFPSLMNNMIGSCMIGVLPGKENYEILDLSMNLESTSKILSVQCRGLKISNS